MIRRASRNFTTLCTALLLFTPALTAQCGLAGHCFTAEQPGAPGSPPDAIELSDGPRRTYPDDPTLSSARWRGHVWIGETGAWTFHVTAADGVQVWVDGRGVIDSTAETAVRDLAGSLRIHQSGWKTLRIEHSNRTQERPLRLAFRPEHGKLRPIPAQSLCRSGSCPVDQLDAGEDQVVTSLDAPLLLQATWNVGDVQPGTIGASNLRWRQVGGPPAGIVTPNEIATEVVPSTAGVHEFEVSLTTPSGSRISDRCKLYLFDDPGDGDGMSEIGAGPSFEGNPEVWQKLTLTFAHNVETFEQDPYNPFTDLRLLVHFVRAEEPNRVITVSGYFAADGNAAETSATSGNLWRAHYRPDKPGRWFYLASFTAGSWISIDTDITSGTPLSFDGTTGVIDVLPADPRRLGFERKGLLRYTGEHHLRFSETGEHFVKSGSNSPENFLGYYEFDGTFDQGGSNNDLASAGYQDGLHHFDPHLQDYVDLGIPTWQGDKGLRIFGAINYLASQNVNSLYFVTYNIDGGDGREVWPWVGNGTDKARFDCSKLDQWGRVFDHMTRAGVMMHVVTQETENDHAIDGGALGNLRKLYYRELVSRFAHVNALIWNLGEENDNSSGQLMAFADYIRLIDPYDHPLTVLPRGFAQQSVLDPLLGTHLEAVSLQGFPAESNDRTRVWVDKSQQRDRAWVVCFDEVGPAGEGVVPDSVDPNHDQMRTQALWGGLMAQGGGAEWYFGYDHPHSDLDCEDFRSREIMWRQTDIAAQFFQRHLPFERMQHANFLTTQNGAKALALAGERYALYLPAGGHADLDLGSSSETFDVGWYDPLAGGDLQVGQVTQVTGPGFVFLGNPLDPTRDWACLVRLADNRPPVVISIETEPNPIRGGTPFAYTVHVDDPDGIEDIERVRTYVLTPQLVPIGYVDAVHNGGHQWALHSPDFPAIPPGTWHLYVVVRDRSFAGAFRHATFEAE